MVRISGARGPLTAEKVYLVECEAAGALPSAAITWFLDGKELTTYTTAVSCGS